jgi:hypothetical protein
MHFHWSAEQAAGRVCEGVLALPQKALEGAKRTGKQFNHGFHG